MPTEWFYKLTTWEPCSYARDSGAASGFPGNHKRGGQGPGSRALARSRPWAQALAASFVIPGDPEAGPGSLAYEHGFQVANLENRSVVDFVERITKGNKIDMAI